MSHFKFAGLPNTSSVAAAVTLAVCAWFPVAGAAMIGERPAPHAGAAAKAIPVVYTAPAVAIAPEARLIIVVEAHRV